MALIGFIGMGNMGYAMLRGSLKNFDKSEIIFADVNEERVKKVYNETGIRFVESNAECANGCKYLVLAVKPQYYPEVLKNIENIITREHVIISIAPGITIEDLKGHLGFDKKIVRAMPNTPALVGEGMSGICFDQKAFTMEELSVIEKIFSGFGKVHAVEEKLMDAVVCASGSSPAYVYMFIEALADNENSDINCISSSNDWCSFVISTPNGNWIEGKGVTPTEFIELDEKYYNNPIKENDNQLNKAIELVGNKIK